MLAKYACILGEDQIWIEEVLSVISTILWKEKHTLLTIMNESYDCYHKKYIYICIFMFLVMLFSFFFFSFLRKCSSIYIYILIYWGSNPCFPLWRSGSMPLGHQVLGKNAPLLNYAREFFMLLKIIVSMGFLVNSDFSGFINHKPSSGLVSEAGTVKRS